MQRPGLLWAPGGAAPVKPPGTCCGASRPARKRQDLRGRGPTRARRVHQALPAMQRAASNGTGRAFAASCFLHSFLLPAATPCMARLAGQWLSAAGSDSIPASRPPFLRREGDSGGALVGLSPDLPSAISHLHVPAQSTCVPQPCSLAPRPHDMSQRLLGSSGSRSRRGP